MKHIGKLAVLGAVLAASAPFASADSLTLSSFATGQALPTGDTAGESAMIYSGSILTGTTEPGTPTAAQSVPQTGGSAPSYLLLPGGVWANPVTGTAPASQASQWVGIAANAGPVGTSNPAYGFYTFETTFNAVGGLYSGTINVQADDTTEVLLNGNVIPGLSFGALGDDLHCAQGSPTCLVQDAVSVSGLSLNAGQNVLQFVVEQAGTGPQGGSGDPSGVDFAANLTQTPEPNSLVLLGTGLLSAAGMLVRKRQTV